MRIVNQELPQVLWYGKCPNCKVKIEARIEELSLSESNQIIGHCPNCGYEVVFTKSSIEEIYGTK